MRTVVLMLYTFPIFPLYAFQEEFHVSSPSSTLDFSSLLSPSMEHLFDDIVGDQGSDTAIEHDSSSAHVLPTSINTQDSHSAAQVPRVARSSRSPLAEALNPAQSQSYENCKSKTIAALTYGYQIARLKKVIFNLDEKLHPGICVDVIDALQKHALSLGNKVDRTDFEILTTLLKLHALEQNVRLSENDPSDPCADNKQCETQLHTRTLNTSLPSADLFFTNEYFTLNELMLGIKHGIFHETMLERLANRFVSQPFSRCMAAVNYHIIDPQKKQALLDYYPKIQISAACAQNRKIISSSLYRWALAMPHLENNELIKRLDQARHAHYHTTHQRDTPLVIKAADDYESNGTLAPITFTASPLLEEHMPISESTSCGIFRPYLVDLTQLPDSQPTSEDSDREYYSEETSADEHESVQHYSPDNLQNAPCPAASLPGILHHFSGKTCSMKELKDSVNAGAFDETMVVEAAIRATNYSGFCQFVQAVSHKISPEQFTALRTHYQQYLNDIKGEKRALIGNQKIAKRLRTFHDTPYDQLKPRTPSTCGRKRGSCKRKRVDNTITFVYENNPK